MTGGGGDTHAGKITWRNEKRRLGELVPWPRNPRQIKTDQAKRLVESFDQFGQVETIAIGPDNGVYNGHQRLNVLASKYGKDYEVEVRVADRELSEKEREKLTVFLHKGAAGEWDFDTLANEFELDDLLEWGFDKKELDLDLWAGPAQDDPGAQMDRAEELREKWGVEAGQMWKLGVHRLICGDCTNRVVVDRVMWGEKADLVFTSPPYGQQRDYRDGATASVSNWDALMQGAFLGVIAKDDVQILVNLGMIHNDGEWQPYYDAWIEWMRSCGWKRFGWYIWDQGFGLMGDWGGRLAPSHEFIFHFNRTAKQPNKTIEKKQESIKVKHGEGLRKKYGSINKLSNPEASLQTHKIPDSVVRIFRSSEPIRELHPAVFSLNFAEFNVEVWSNQNNIVYEPFSGSGTTLIACERLGRKCRAVEISPAYCAVAIDRWATMTGGEPVLVTQDDSR